MKPPNHPLSRPVLVTRLPPGGLDVSVEASGAERDALAGQFGLPSLFMLIGEFRVRAQHDRVTATGRIRAEVEQVCVVSLDPFRSTIEEQVEVSFTETTSGSAMAGDVDEHEIDPDEPDPIVDGRIDLGHLTAEFLALGLDPYPKKPGVRFEEGEWEATMSPFAKLATLKAGS